MSSPIRNVELLRRSKVFSWEMVKQFTPRGIEPSDIESVIEVNKHFMYFEFKEIGATMPKGQRLMYERMLESHRSRACLVLAEHDKLLETVNVLADVRAVTLLAWDAEPRAIISTDRMEIDEPRKFGWWIEQWCLHAEEKPNHFITTFRRRAGVYPRTSATPCGSDAFENA